MKAMKKICSSCRKLLRTGGDGGRRIRVCVGKGWPPESTTFEVEANFLNHPLFQGLLNQTVDEFGYSYSGALRIVCDVDLFLHLLHLLRSGDPSVHYMELQDVVAKSPLKFHASC